jgi:CheY-like chemotaxis protein
MRAANTDVPLIAKIERPQALEHLDAILAAVDGVMVARGDLGLECPLEQIPRIQKTIIARARALGRPVILATQVLESMRTQPRPTRAEVSDAATAVDQGVDAIMLAGETAAGDYPVEAVRTLEAVILDALMTGMSGFDTCRKIREAKGAGILSHPNIVTVFDVGEEDNHPYLAMEWVEGTTLADVLKQGRKFTPKEVVEIGVQLARALDYAHRKGIVHRDVKPGNVMLVKDSLTVKVADFGICRISEADTHIQGQQTQMGDVLGTPHYMSPEQIHGDPADERSDMYSFGAVLFEAITGLPPYDAESVRDLCMQHIEAPVPEPTVENDTLPRPLIDLVMRCLAKKPADRFASMREVADALADVERNLDRRGWRRWLPR